MPRDDVTRSEESDMDREIRERKEAERPGTVVGQTPAEGETVVPTAPAEGADTESESTDEDGDDASEGAPV